MGLVRGNRRITYVTSAGNRDACAIAVVEGDPDRLRGLDARLLHHAGASVLVGCFKKDVAVRDPHRYWPKANTKIAWMATGIKAEFIAVPRTDNMSFVGEPQASAGLVRHDYLLDPVEQLALANRPAVVRAPVLVGNAALAKPEDAYLQFAHGHDAVIAIGQLSP
jgi:hypothetical protein